MTTDTPILCPDCGDDIDAHSGDDVCLRCIARWEQGDDIPLGDVCCRAPSEIARRLIEEAKLDRPVSPACPVHDPGMWDDVRNEGGDCICPVPRAEYESIVEQLLTAEPTFAEVKAAAWAIVEHERYAPDIFGPARCLCGWTGNPGDAETFGQHRARAVLEAARDGR